jgi:hypothetical protein
MSWQPKQRIDQAMLGLEFAIKLMNYVELRKLDKDSFDTDTIVLLPGGSLTFKTSSFHTYDDLILGAQNLYSQALAVSAVAMEAALQQAGIPNDSTDVTDRGQLRTLVYMIRCCFAHDLQAPTWEVRGQYAKPLAIRFGRHNATIDLKVLNGTPFELEQIGGALLYWELVREVQSWLQ